MSDPVKVIYGRDGQRADHTLSDVFDENGGEFKSRPGPTAEAFQDQAEEAAWDAKATVAALAGEARARFADIVDQQKAVGADQVAGVARAVQSAAGDLEQTNPQLARFVKSAADRVDHVADNIRQSDVSQVIASLTDFGRRRPVAFFGGAMAAGFLLARFLKSDTPAA